MKYVPAGTLNTASDVAAVPVSKLVMSLSPAAVPACTTYDVGASPLAGADQFSVTTDPLTDPKRLLGTPGALMAAATAPGRIRELVTRGGHPDPNAPVVPAALVKQAHDTETTAGVWPVGPTPGATLMAVEGAAGVRTVPPPHAETQSKAAVTTTADRVLMSPPAYRAGTRILENVENAGTFRQTDSSVEIVR